MKLIFTTVTIILFSLISKADIKEAVSMNMKKFTCGTAQLDEDKGYSLNRLFTTVTLNSQTPESAITAYQLAVVLPGEASGSTFADGHFDLTNEPVICTEVE